MPAPLRPAVRPRGIGQVLTAVGFLGLALLAPALAKADEPRLVIGPDASALPAIGPQQLAPPGGLVSLLPVPAAASIDVRQSPHATSGPRIDVLGASYTTLTSPTGVLGFGYSVSAVGDVNGDGYADFVVTCSGAGRAYLYVGSPTGVNPTPFWTNATTLAVGAKVAAAGDVNGDGYDDVMFFGGAGDSLHVYHGGPSGLSLYPAFNAGGAPGFAFSGMTAGDTNGDGYDDIVIGNLYSSGEQVYIWMGSATGLASPARALISPETPARFGFAVAGIGDLNADGFDDILVGAPDAVDANGGHGGAVFLYYGSPTGIATGSAPSQKQTAPTYATLQDYGSTIAPAGDFDGDGYADILVGDPHGQFSYYRGIGYLHAGHAFGINGNLILPMLETIAAKTYGGQVFTAGDVNGDGRADVLIVSTGETSGTGDVYLYLGGDQDMVQQISGLPSWGTLNATTAGDVNGDGFADVVIGIPDAGSGQVRVYFGHADPPTDIWYMARYGGSTGDLAGWSVATGDVNGDGYDDVVVGKPHHDTVSYVQAGRIELYLGGPNGINSPAFSFDGIDANGALGVSVDAGGDVNGDGFGDIVASAPGVGKVFVIFGRTDWTGANYAYYTFSTGGLYGAWVSIAGDVNGDGIADVLIGEPGYDQPSPPTTDGGRVVLWYGGRPYPTYSGWTPACNQSYANEGNCVAGAGDVNNDGYSDIVIGTGPYDGTAGADAGHARLYLGGPVGPSNLPAREWQGQSAGDWFGSGVDGVGDFDGDGYGDVAIGAYNANKACVARGNASGAEAVPTYTIPAPQLNGAFGSSIASAGDVNGDGYSDLWVGEVFGDLYGLTDNGLVYVFLGGPAPSLSPYATYTGEIDYENVGHAIANGGDVNGDGFADLVFGAPRGRQDYFDEGVFRVVAGASAYWPLAGYSAAGHPGPAHLTRPDYITFPLATYDCSPRSGTVGLALFGASAGGRDRLAVEWKITPTPNSTGGSSGVTAWTGSASAVQVNIVATGLGSNGAFAWKARPRARSPYFRFGMWYSPQANGRGQWDFRTAPANVDVAPVMATPATVELAPAFPNPARGEAACVFALPRPMSATLTVRDLQGRTVRTLATGPQQAGRHRFSWNGADESGRACAAGLYFIDLEAGGERHSSRLVLTR